MRPHENNQECETSDMTDTSKLCMGCMHPKEGTGPCPNCGFDDTQPQDVAFLPLRTVIADRYVVGKVLSTNGEAITYLGLDGQTGHMVQVREYMPSVLCGRRMDGTIAINAGCETNYKTLLVEYEEILKALRQLGHLSGVLPVMDICRQNNTVYGIFQDIHAIPLGKFLSRCGGELSWSRAKRIFLPLLNTISNLHAGGLIHRGICPDTVLIDRSGDLWLIDFSTPALRTSHSEIEPELCAGYAAPEQYNPQMPQGTWTDVYAVGALMYKTLTGTMPPQATTRRINDNLCPCIQLNPSIPQNVSDAICAAMEIDPQRRTQTIEELISALLQAAESKTSVYHAKRPETVEEKAVRPEPPAPRYRKNHSAIYAVGAMLVTFVLLGFAFTKLIDPILETEISQPVSSDVSQSSSGGIFGPNFLADNNVPNFVGMSREDVEGTALYAEKYNLSFREEQNDDYAEGVIFNQSPDAGTPMQNKGTVVLYVSTGPATVPMPDVAGKTVEEASKILDSYGIVNYEVIESFEDGEDDVVLRTNIQPGTLIRSKDKVMLIVKSQDMSSSSEPEEDEEDADEDESSPSHVIVVIPRSSSSER